jgi:hypothetical protein
MSAGSFALSFSSLHAIEAMRQPSFVLTNVKQLTPRANGSASCWRRAV